VRRLRQEREALQSREAWLAAERARLLRLEREDAEAVERLAKEQAQAAKQVVEARIRQARARRRSAEVALKRIDAESSALQKERHGVVRAGIPLLKR
jgi:hypothetical protein